MFIEKTVECPHPGGSHPVVYSEFPGNPAKTVVCVHGLSRNGRDFDRLAESLAREGYRMICPDMPGRGRSAYFDDATHYNYPQYVSDMMTLIDTLGVDKVDWIGTSMGGLIGMSIAALPNNPIRRMVINDIGPFLPKEAVKDIKTYVAMNPSLSSWETFLDAFKVRMASFGMTDEEAEAMARTSVFKEPDGRMRLNYDTRIIVNIIENNGVLEDVDLWPLWDNVNVPMLILRGGESSLLQADTLEKMMIGKEAKAITFPNIGHAPALVNAEQIGAIKDWLMKTSLDPALRLGATGYTHKHTPT